MSRDPFLNDVLGELFSQPGPMLELRTSGGEVVAYMVKSEAMDAMVSQLGGVARPVRGARPKGPLSKRQRDAAKRERLHGQEAAGRS